MNQPWKDKLFATLIFLVVYLSHTSSSVITSYDSRWAVLTALSIAQEGNLDLSEYDDLLQQNKNYCIHERNGRKYNLFPIGTPLLSLPLVVAFDFAPSFMANFVPGTTHLKRKQDQLNAVTARLPLERAIASFFVALASVMMFLIGQKWLPTFKAVLLSAAFAFGTSSWSTASRGLWQHGPSMLLLSMALLLVLNKEKLPKRACVLGALLAFSYVVRPTNSISFAFFAIYLGFENYKILWRYFFGAAVIFIPFITLNLNVYDSLLPPYFSAERISVNPHFFQALIGNWISAGRGLLVFTPILFFSFWGIFSFIKTKETKPLSLMLVAIIIFHWLAISSYPQWWGGHSYGPRLFSDMLPFFCFFLIPSIKKIGASFMWMATWFLLLELSIFIHFRGANVRSTQRWNTVPISIDEDPRRLWDYKDLQFLR